MFNLLFEVQWFKTVGRRFHLLEGVKRRKLLISSLFLKIAFFLLLPLSPTYGRLASPQPGLSGQPGGHQDRLSVHHHGPGRGAPG